ncbi:MAG: HAMP domain-containing sensor histidine kinase [Candidatus Gracilibacteria bacterium]
MEKEIKNMKLKLSLLSVFLVSILIFIFGTSFLVFKYYSVHKASLDKITNYEKNINNLSFSGVNNMKENPNYKILFNNFFILFDDKGKILYNNSPFLSKNDLEELLYGLKYENLIEDDGYIRHTYDLKNKYKLITLFFLSYSKEQLYYDLIKYFISIIIISIFIYIILYKFISYLLKPIEENFTSMKYFVQVAGHELKTPISVISSGIQLLKQTKTYDEETIDEIKLELDKSDKLINGLIDLYNINNLSTKDKIKVSEIVYEVLKNLNLKIKENDIKINIDFGNEIDIYANKYYVYILIFNLLSNAIKYSKKGGKIIININNKTLRIKDFGFGISKKDESKIFDLFYRVSSHRDIEGFGLGLAIVKKIINTYNWKIKIDSIVGIGSEFIVKFS